MGRCLACVNLIAFAMNRSWKTTACGIAALVGTVIIQFYPEFARHGNALIALATGVGLLVARDNNVTSDQLGLPEKQAAKATEAEAKKEQTP